MNLSAPSSDRAALSIDLLLAQPLVDSAAMGFGQAGLIGMGQVVRFVVALIVCVRFHKCKSELHAWQS